MEARLWLDWESNHGRFWVAQRRGPRTARFSRAGVERFQRCVYTATKPDGFSR